ncbi:MaoC family dehydratase [Thiosulfatihalobacter marinus]|uniref:MaoC family dehydratase n=2 Tax=Thiosulfatihalobacter marinus TaxID=2792481 RepID=UPI0018D6743D
MTIDRLRCARPHGTMTFDPTQHSTHPRRAFADFRIGEVFRAPSRTMTEGVFAAFQAASGDNHPIHYDRPYCARQGHANLLAHGYQTLIQAAIGASPLAHEMGEALIGFLSQSSRFLAPVLCGDTLYPEFEITALEPRRTTGAMTLAIRIFNQDGVLVADGHQSYLMRL